MPILEIDGVGKVDVGDGFTSMAPADQDSFVNEITQAHASGVKASPGAGNTSMPDAAARGFGQGATFGWGDELAGAAAASPIPMNPAGKSQLGSIDPIDVLAGGARIGLEKLLPSVFGKGGQDAYGKERDRIRGLSEQASADRPYSYGAGQIGGSILSGAPIAGAAGGAMQGGSLLQRAAIGAATSAPLGAVQGAGEAKDIASIPKDAAIGGFVGGVAGGALPFIAQAAKRAISPIAASPERQALVDVLRKEGVDLTAGQATGSKPLQWVESSLGDLPGAGRKAAEFSERQGQQFTQAALKRMGATGPLATPDVLDTATKRIGQEFERLSANNTLKYDPQFAQDISRTISQYDRVLPSQQKQVVAAYLQDILNQPQGMPGTMYQEARSTLSRQANALTNSDPALSNTLKGFQKALDGAMDRSISPQDQAAWQTARTEWRNWKAIEKASTGAGERAAQGYISPSQLRNAVVTQNRGGYARGQGDLAELARAGEGVMRPLPQSGTAPRSNVNNMIGLLAAGGGGAAGGIPGAMLGAAAPAMVGRLLMSRPVQAYLGNQLATGPTSARAAMLEQLLAAPARDLLVSRQNDR